MASKISVYSLSELKTTLDDHIPMYLTSPNLPATSTPLSKAQRLTESHSLANVRLALGYTSVVFALYIFYLDYYLKVPWSEHKAITVYAVFAYFVLNAALTAWIYLGERGAIFLGSRKKGKDGTAALELRLSSHGPKQKYEPTYRLGAEWTSVTAAGKEEKGKAEAQAPFRLFFQADGTFVSGEFERWLRKTVPVIAPIVAGDSTTKIEGTSTSVSRGTVPSVVIDKPPPEEGDTIVVEAAPSTPARSGRDSTPSGTAKKRTKKKG